MNRTLIAAGVLACTALALGACGSSNTDRGLSGAGIGAAGGLVAGALVGSPATGALVGAAVGGATGVLTDRDQIDLGRPVWD